MITSELREYIENNIEYLDEKKYYFFLLNALSEIHSNNDLDELIDVLYKIEDSKELIDKAREDVLRFYITMQIEEYADDETTPSSYSIAQFILRYLAFYLGYNPEEIVDFILDNQAEWADNMIEKNGHWRICK